MRIAALYDIHGNLPALDAVLQAVEAAGVDLLVVGGDVASGPMPRETIERLRGLGARACLIRGNAERELVAMIDGEPAGANLPPEVLESTRWCARQIDPAGRDFLASFVPEARFTVDGLGEVLFCHATPRSDEALVTIATPAARFEEAFAGAGAPIVVCGHTHMQFDRQAGAVRVINAGSVGMPYGEPGAYWALLGPGVELRRTGYDLDAAAALLRKTGYPLAEDFAVNNVLHPPSADEALAVFEPGVG